MQQLLPLWSPLAHLRFCPQKLHRKYFVFIQLMHNPLPSKISLHSSNLLLASSLVSATRTILWAKSIPYCTVSQINLDISCIMTVKMKWLNVDPWCSPTLVGKDSVILTGVWMLVETLLYMSCIASMYLCEVHLDSILEVIPNNSLWYAIICFLHVDQHHKQLLLTLPILFHQSSQKINCRIGWKS